MAQATLPRGPVSGTAVQPPKKKAPFPIEFYRSAIGKKYVMAITGIIWLGFVFAHMFGNLKMYFGQEEFDHYAEFLRDLLYPILPHTWALWGLRIVLAVALLLHVHAATSLTIMNRKARPVAYQSHRDYVAANFASRSMRITGIVVALFILWHLADLTWGWVNPDFVKGAVYDNTVASLNRVPVAALYVVANLALGVHLFHGAWSIFQSLGWNNPRFNAWRRWFAWAFAAVVVIGNVSFPLAVQFDIVG